LSSDTYDAIDRLKSGNGTDDLLEPGWDQFYFVSGFRVTNERILGDRALVEVEYSIEGIDSYPTLQKFSLTAIERFHLALVNSEWKIKDIINLPRISVERAIKHYEELIQSYGRQKNTKEVERLGNNLLRMKDIQADLIRWPRKTEEMPFN
jgi:hypothetical protein